MLTEKGKILLLSLAVTLCVAWYSQIELIYLIAATLAAVIITALILFRFLPSNLRCARHLPHSAYENQTLQVKFVLENPGPFTGYNICLIDNFTAELPHRQNKLLLFSHLGKYETVTQAYEGFCPQRGVYWIGPLTIICQDPFGIFKRQNILDTCTKLTVYPRTFNIRDLCFFNRGIVAPRYGPQTTRRSGDYEEFFGIRQYHQEDGLRKIHWPSSAKYNQLMVRHFEQTGINTASVIVDLKWQNNLGSGRETTLEYAVKLAGSLAKYFLDQGFLVQLLAYAEEPIISSFGKDPSHFSVILDILAEVQANSLYGLNEALTRLNHCIPPTSTLAVIRLDKDSDADLALEQIVYAKNLSLVDIQLISSSFDANILESPRRFLEVKGSEITEMSISRGDNLELKFMAK